MLLHHARSYWCSVTRLIKPKTWWNSFWRSWLENHTLPVVPGHIENVLIKLHCEIQIRFQTRKQTGHIFTIHNETPHERITYKWSHLFVMKCEVMTRLENVVSLLFAAFACNGLLLNFNSSLCSLPMLWQSWSVYHTVCIRPSKDRFSLSSVSFHSGNVKALRAFNVSALPLWASLKTSWIHFSYRIVEAQFISNASLVVVRSWTNKSLAGMAYLSGCKHTHAQTHSEGTDIQHNTETHNQ